MTKDVVVQLQNTIERVRVEFAQNNIVDFDVEDLTAKDCWGDGNPSNIDKTPVLQITFRISADADLKEYLNVIDHYNES